MPNLLLSAALVTPSFSANASLVIGWFSLTKSNYFFLSRCIISMLSFSFLLNIRNIQYNISSNIYILLIISCYYFLLYLIFRKIKQIQLNISLAILILCYSYVIFSNITFIFNLYFSYIYFLFFLLSKLYMYKYILYQ